MKSFFRLILLISASDGFHSGGATVGAFSSYRTIQPYVVCRGRTSSILCRSKFEGIDGKTTEDEVLELVGKLETQYKEIGNQYKEMGKTLSILKNTLAIEDGESNSINENPTSDDHQTASEMMSKMAMAGAGGSPSILSFLQQHQSEEEAEEDLSFEARKMEIEELGGDPFFLGEEEEDKPDNLSGSKDVDKQTPSEMMSKMAMGGVGGMPSILSFLQDSQSKEEEVDEEEDLSFEARRMEIEELGGDPFFLDDEGDDDSEMIPKIDMVGGEPTVRAAEERRITDGLGPTPRFDEAEFEDPDREWDGIVNEDAHLGFD